MSISKYSDVPVDYADATLFAVADTPGIRREGTAVTFGRNDPFPTGLIPERYPLLTGSRYRVYFPVSRSFFCAVRGRWEYRDTRR